MAGASLAAVVMAGGLGTRMRSATPKHLHPILGRRMVDWVFEAARPLGPDPLVVDRFTREPRRVRRHARCRAGAGARHRRRRSLGAGSGGGERRRTSSSSPATRRSSRPSCSRRSSRSIEREGAARHRALVRPRRRSLVRPRRTRAGRNASRGSSRPATRRPSSSRSSECNSSIYVFRADLLWPALDRLEPHNVQGELYLTDAVRDLVARGERVVAHVAADPAETEGVNTRVELAAAAATLRDRINREHMLAGVAIVDPGLDLDRAAR